MNIGDDDYDDIPVVNHGAVSKLKFALLISCHAEHDLIPADSPRNLALGYACIDCNVCWEIILASMSKSCGHPNIDDFLKKVVSFHVNRTSEGILAILEEHPNTADKLKRLSCMM